MGNPINYVDPLGLKGTFGDNFNFSFKANVDFFFEGYSQLSRTAIGVFTIGQVAPNITGLPTAFPVARAILFGTGGAATLGISSSALFVGAAINTATNVFVVGSGVSIGILVGSTIDAIIQTYLVPEDIENKESYK